ncbi:hypothetical protein GMA12_05005 [Kocuria sediminis]|uniref:STAS domain-containing protein n=1 Tax=Kocuria sediminis TaxID=1038857 RepID=A0A6N8GHC3_9MICC|nr:hypothetical protein [Kocuria sediminis]MUN62501.1 hypothetical protein [Kocuria sediminis]
MDHHVSVLVQIDRQSAAVRLVVSGCLTEHNHQAVRPLVLRARTLVAPANVTVDLTCAEHVEASAVDLLRWSLDEDAMLEQIGPVELLLPDPLPEHRPAPYSGHRGRDTVAGLAA